MRMHAMPRRALTTGDGAGWIGGVPGQTAITPSWLCQPGAGASCPIEQVATCPAAALQASLQCPSASCHAQDVRAPSAAPLLLPLHAFQPFCSLPAIPKLDGLPWLPAEGRVRMPWSSCTALHVEETIFPLVQRAMAAPGTRQKQHARMHAAAAAARAAASSSSWHG